MTTILLVEDNEPSRDALGRRLQRRGYVLSAHAMTDDRELAMAAGGDDFDSKPIRFERLLDKIEALLAKSGAAS